MITFILNIAKITVAFVFSVWAILFTLHFFTTNQIITDFSPALATYDTDAFQSFNGFRIGTLFDDNSTSDIQEDPLLKGWADQCSLTAVVPPAKPSVIPPTLVSEVVSETYRLDVEASKANQDIQSIRDRSVAFTALLITLGCLTTIMSALNSSEIGSGGSFLARSVKILAIVFPALATAVTAYSALYAPSDTAARQTQLHFGLETLKSNFILEIAAVDCTNASATDIKKLSAEVLDTNQKYAQLLTNAEVTQGKDSTPATPTPVNPPPAPVTPPPSMAP